MGNLNAEQIIKALECCFSDGCEFCPYSHMPTLANCVIFTMGNALALIKELTEENAKLARSCTELEQKCASLTSESVEKCASVKADTVRKMQERLKAQKFTHKNLGELVYVEDIDQSANELLEGSDET